MDGKVLRSSISRKRKGEAIKPVGDDVEYQIVEERVDLEIRKVLRISPKNLSDCMISFAKWAKDWE